MEKLTFGRRLAAVLFPERCACCDTVIPAGEGVCARCEEAMPWIGDPVCPFCGMEKGRCTCEKRRRHYERVVAPFYYEGLVQSGVLRLKAGGDTITASFFATQTAQAVRQYYDGIIFDAVTFVPMSKSQERARESYTSRLLAAKIAAALGLPLLPLLQKVTETPPQKALPAEQRSGNVLGVFDLAPGAQVERRTILLVDDVTTTGATLDECAKMLKIYGAAAVYAAVAAATAAQKAPPVSSEDG